MILSRVPRQNQPNAQADRIVAKDRHATCGGRRASTEGTHTLPDGGQYGHVQVDVWLRGVPFGGKDEGFVTDVLRRLLNLAGIPIPKEWS